MVHIHDGIVFSHKKNPLIVTTWTKSEIIMMGEINQTPKVLHKLIHVEDKRVDLVEVEID
jgi:hypothetical protein